MYQKYKGALNKANYRMLAQMLELYVVVYFLKLLDIKFLVFKSYYTDSEIFIRSRYLSFGFSFCLPLMYERTNLVFVLHRSWPRILERNRLL